MVWLLGSSPQSAIWAAELGLPYAFADFISPDGAELAQTYRTTFVPSERQQHPHVAVAVSAVCADTGEEADRLSSSIRMAITLLRRGQLVEVPTVEAATAFLAIDGANGAARSGRRVVAGAPLPTVRAGLEEVAHAYGADELLVVTITHDHAARRRSYELIAGAFGLSGRAATEARPIGQV